MRTSKEMLTIFRHQTETASIMGLVFPSFENSGSGQNIVATFGDQDIPRDAVYSDAQGLPRNIGNNLWGPLVSLCQVCVISGDQT